MECGVCALNELTVAPVRVSITMLGADGRGSEAGERPRSVVPFGTARPLTCILWKRPQHKPTLCAGNQLLLRGTARTMSLMAGSTAVCPHCKTGVRFEAGSINPQGIPHQLTGGLFVNFAGNAWLELMFAACPVCGAPVLSISRVGLRSGGQVGGPGMVYPQGASRPLPPEVHAAVPTLAADFAEAVAVLPVSRKASAALSRRCLQFILVNAAKCSKRDLIDQIEEVLPKLPEELALNVDAIRHVGNFAAHPLKSTSTGEIVEVDDGEAEWLLDVLEELCEHYYVAPAQASSRRAALNQKLAELGKPPLKKP